MTGSEYQNYNWDAAGRMVQAIPLDPNTAQPAMQNASTYEYDSEGHLVYQSNSQLTEASAWSEGEIIEQLGGPPSNVAPGSSSPAYSYTRSGSLVVATGGLTVLDDGLGSVSGTWNGQQANVVQFDAWGGYEQGSIATTTPTMGYTGHLWDSNAGELYGKARWEVPGLGEWLSEDPVGVTSDRLMGPNGLNGLLHANGNPTRYTDPTGMWSLWETLVALRDGIHASLNKVTIPLHNALSSPFKTIRGIPSNVGEAIVSLPDAPAAVEVAAVKFNNYATQVGGQCNVAVNNSEARGDAATGDCVRGMLDIVGTTYLAAEGTIGNDVCMFRIKCLAQDALQGGVS